MAHCVYAGVDVIARARNDASRTQSTLNSAGILFRYWQIRSKLKSVAQRARADATAYWAAGLSGTGSRCGFNRMASILGRSRNIRRNPENSVAAPFPTAPANSSCSTPGDGPASRIFDRNSQERGEGNEFASFWKSESS